ncbi:hypothetical protein C8F04DRAFT_1192094 [Mycena alexandri]|uniref:Uncharacterized protein n=1 Tax=Mycena alexandri TaxID=1745969 RepID=A0AAD6SBH9_9AGAR|nr:hypothetical protein C8F04DRAFT_1192094 [Mycena alexandri]
MGDEAGGVTSRHASQGLDERRGDMGVYRAVEGNFDEMRQQNKHGEQRIRRKVDVVELEMGEGAMRQEIQNLVVIQSTFLHRKALAPSKVPESDPYEDTIKVCKPARPHNAILVEGSLRLRRQTQYFDDVWYGTCREVADLQLRPREAKEGGAMAEGEFQVLHKWGGEKNGTQTVRYFRHRCVAEFEFLQYRKGASELSEEIFRVVLWNPLLLTAEPKIGASPAVRY